MNRGVIIQLNVERITSGALWRRGHGKPGEEQGYELEGGCGNAGRRSAAGIRLVVMEVVRSWILIIFFWLGP